MFGRGWKIIDSFRLMLFLRPRKSRGHSAGDHDAEHEKAEDCRKQTQISIDPEAKVIVRAMQSMRQQKKAADTAKYKRRQGPEPTLLLVGLCDLTREGKR